MHNMLEEYYRFLCERLVSWSKNVDVTPGDRYVLSFEDANQVRNFMSVLKDLSSVHSFKIATWGSNIEGLSIKVNSNDLKLVTISTNDVTPDYLVNLRNQIGKQEGIWENTALLFISNQILDSINSGAKDISRYGGPFNLHELRRNMSEEIYSNSSLEDAEKSILNSMVNAFEKDEQYYTLMDFADVYAVIEKGHISDSDYTNMGYFRDSSLKSFADDEIEKRLTENREDFSKVRMFQSFGDAKEQVSKMVEGQTISKELSGKDWQNVDYDKILEGKDKLNQLSKNKIKYLSDQVANSNPGFPIWDQSKSDTAAGQRNRSIIIFNKYNESEIALQFPFSQTIQKDGYKEPKNKGILIGHSRNKLKVNLNISNLNDTFHAKVIYSHVGKTTLKFTFNILVIPLNEKIFENIRTAYTLNISGKKAVIRLPREINNLELGTGERLDRINAKTVQDLDGLRVTTSNRLEINTRQLELFDDKQDDFSIFIWGVKIDFAFIDDAKSIVPRNPIFIENYRRQHDVDGHYWNNQVSFGDQAFSVYNTHQKFLKRELEMIQNNALTENTAHFVLSKQLKLAYMTLFKELNSRSTVMSLVHWDKTIYDLVGRIIEVVNSEIVTSSNSIELQPEVKNIVHIGELQEGENIVFAPFNPMLLSYQLEVEKRVGKETISDTIERKLNPTHLVPFLKRLQLGNDYGEVGSMDYRAIQSSDVPRWLVYERSGKISINEDSRVIITERMKDFRKHFNYLFANHNNHFIIRAENIEDSKSLIKGISDYLIDQINKNRDNLSAVNTVDLFVAHEGARNSRYLVSEFYQLTNKEEYVDYFETTLKKIVGLSERQILETMQNKLNIYYEDNKKIDAHITFYQFENRLLLGQYNSQELTVNSTIGGLIGGQEYTKVQMGIKSGFGMKGLKPNHSGLLQFAQNWNELLVATVQDHSVMAHGQTLSNNIEEINSEKFQQQFDTSNWVTLLNPEMKLDYFNQMNKNVYVIHYTDYTNSANYESITLTKQVDQYKIILSENLPEDISQRNDESFLSNIINSFNVINGEWLLRLVSHRDQFNTVKEKLSILATYKEMMGILYLPGTIWLPLSLEEILRVAGSFVGENREDSVFSAKSLGLELSN